MIYLLLFLLIVSVFLEGTVTTLPLVFICLLCLTILIRSSLIFFVAFFAGILLDAFALRSIGATSIFLLLAVFLILLYQRKYEINTFPFVLMASFLGSLLFLILFGYAHVFWLAIVSAIVASLVYGIIRFSRISIS